ncbi:MAG: Tim44/TimA family putative adaptor protein [Proteobacteria bacterium]|nr:Tim44/TimA family putative adaptor protein [Pseudomonadota bacterium]
MDIIILAAIAIYIFIKLRQQLGKVDEEQKRDAIRNFIKEQTKTQNGKTTNKQGVVVNIVDGKIIEETQAPQIDQESQDILNGLEEPIRKDLENVLNKAQISAANFINGATKAFELIIEAFAKGDQKALKPLLSDKIFQQFALAIKNRDSENQILHNRVLSIDESKITNAQTLKNDVTITVQFTSKQINYITDTAGELIDGSKEDVNLVNDVWTFKKDVKSNNPNWLVCATTS